MRVVLIVEDNEKNMKLARDILQAKGFATLEATSAEQGIRLAQEQIPDLVLMDIQLGGMNGIEAFELLRADPRTAAIPVAAFTASVMSNDRNRVTLAGFDALLSKPINLKEFVATITRLTSSAES